MVGSFHALSGKRGPPLSMHGLRGDERIELSFETGQAFDLGRHGIKHSEACGAVAPTNKSRQHIRSRKIRIPYITNWFNDAVVVASMKAVELSLA